MLFHLTSREPGDLPAFMRELMRFFPGSVKGVGMAELTLYPVKIFYDGSCSLCAAKMEFYRRKEQNNRLVFVDISDPSFDPIPYGIPFDRFMYEMHAIDGRGNVYRGVDAFRVIWQAFPSSTRYGLMGALINLPMVHLMGRLIYRGVARMRRFLPKNHETCKDGTCGLGKGKDAHT